MVNALNATDLFPLKWLIVSPVNFTSIKSKQNESVIICILSISPHISDHIAWDDRECELQPQLYHLNVHTYRAHPFSSLRPSLSDSSIKMDSENPFCLPHSTAGKQETHVKML